jgi:hypothetical protein
MANPLHAAAPTAPGDRRRARHPQDRRRVSPNSSLHRNNGPQRRIACRRDAIGTAVWLFFDPALRNHAGNRSASGWMQSFLRQPFSIAHLLQRTALKVVRNVIRPPRHSLSLRLQSDPSSSTKYAKRISSVGAACCADKQFSQLRWPFASGALIRSHRVGRRSN